MFQLCPTCHNELNPMHAPVAKVRTGKVVNYCSGICAAVDDGHDSEIVVSSVQNSLETAEVISQGCFETHERGAFWERSRVDGILDTFQKGGAERQRTTVLVASGATMLAGLAVVLQTLLPGATSSVSAAATQHSGAPTHPDGEPSTGEAVKPIANSEEWSPLRVRAVAMQELEHQLENGTLRSQRLSAMALARIAHPRAVAVLLVLLDTETSVLARIDIAYGLAVAGQMRGHEYLRQATKNKNLDVRIDAGRRLAQLSDDTGRISLLRMLGSRSHSLAAASILASLGDKKGIAFLTTVFSNRLLSIELRMRAAVGLGRAGDHTAAPFLREILGEGRYVVDAAGALAVLGDRGALSALEEQLNFVSLRVSAAMSLMQLEHSVDLAGLVSAMATNTVDGRITAAEAILILTDGLPGIVTTSGPIAGEGD